MHKYDSRALISICEAAQLIDKVEAGTLQDVAESFAAYSGQDLKGAWEAFTFCGLSPVDFLMSDFLCQHGLKNLPQVIAEKQQSATFEELYFAEIANDINAKRYYCYVRAESKYQRMHGRRKYKNWRSFRNSLYSAMKKKKVP